MTVPLVLTIGGLIMLVLALVGGGVAVKEVVIPKIPGWLRVFSFLLGVALIGAAIQMSKAPATLPAGVSNVTVTATETPLAQPTATVQQAPQTSPAAIPMIVPTPTPMSLGTISVPGNSSEGIRFTATQPGQYILKYVNGAYSIYPVPSIPPGEATWLTSVRAFKNRPVEWNGIAISDFPDIHVANYPYSFSANEAESQAKGQTTTVSLSKGDYLILVAVDGRPHYSDNPGEVVLEVLFIPTQ